MKPIRGNQIRVVFCLSGDGCYIKILDFIKVGDEYNALNKRITDLSGDGCYIKILDFIKVGDTFV